jgi:putative DNA methylase
MLDEAEKRIGYLYPKIEITEEMAKERPDLQQYVGHKLTVIAWLWARTVKSSNPAFKHVDVPLASSFMLSTKEGMEAYVEPVIEGDSYRFTVKVGQPKDVEAVKMGTTAGKRRAFSCLLSGTPITYDHIREEGKAGRMGVKLMAIVAKGKRGRVYLSPTEAIEAVPLRTKPEWKPDTPLPVNPRDFKTPNYGLTTFADLFTSRQLVALTTLSDLVLDAHERVKHDAIATGMCDDGKNLSAGGMGTQAYADSVGVYLAFALDKQADLGNSLCRWEPIAQCPRQLFGRQAIPMVWDFAEGNPMGSNSGAWIVFIEGIYKAILKSFETVQPSFTGTALQADASTQNVSFSKIVSTDPPYYDNIGYADLSDFFYIWLRRSLRNVFPELFATLAVPKAEELVATPYRHGGNEAAEVFFMDGMTQAMHRLADQAHFSFPVTIYYAFKQSETEKEGTASTGWEIFLDAVIKANFVLVGTWPIRTENNSRMIGQGTNALASSIVLVCRPRPTNASIITRREFLNQLKNELPEAFKHLQHGNIAPVDLAQAAIGPGMAVFTRYSKVLDAEGNSMSVREALSLINEVLDEALAEQEGDFDADSRWALAWFEQYGFDAGEYGVAETLSTAKNTSVSGMVEAGILASKAGKVRLLKPEELPADWDPATDTRLTVWETVHHLIRVLEAGGEIAAAELVVKLESKADVARELAYRLYTLCERKKRANEALAYNALVQSWPELLRLSTKETKLPKGQTTFKER